MVDIRAPCMGPALYLPLWSQILALPSWVRIRIPGKIIDDFDISRLGFLQILFFRMATNFINTATITILRPVHMV